MSLIKCVECNHDISDKAKQCQYCGYKYNNFIIKKKIIILAIISFILLIAFLGVYILKNIDNNYYSKSKINNLAFNENTITILKQNSLDTSIVIGYMQDFMEQYNYSFKNEKTIELSKKGKTFNNYWQNEFKAIPNDEFTKIILDFAELQAINSKYIVSELHISMNYNNNEFNSELIIDDKYYEYQNAIKEKIDNLLEKYFK